MVGVSRTRGEVIAQLATVAVAATAGAAATIATGGAALPVVLVTGAIAGGAEAVDQLLELMRSRFRRGDAGGALRDEINRAVTASLVRFPEEQAQGGAWLAAQIVATRGLSTEQLAVLGFDPERAANDVLAAAALRDIGWGAGDPVYLAAGEAIHATYRVITRKLLEQEPGLLPSIEQLRVELSDQIQRLGRELGGRLAQTELQVSELAADARVRGASLIRVGDLCAAYRNRIITPLDRVDFEGRDDEIAAISTFARSDSGEQWWWWNAGPWAGKTTLMAGWRIIRQTEQRR